MLDLFGKLLECQDTIQARIEHCQYCENRSYVPLAKIGYCGSSNHLLDIKCKLENENCPNGKW